MTPELRNANRLYDLAQANMNRAYDLADREAALEEISEETELLLRYTFKRVQIRHSEFTLMLVDVPGAEEVRQAVNVSAEKLAAWGKKVLDVDPSWSLPQA